MCSDDDSGNEDALEMEYSEAEAEELKRNAEVHAHYLQASNSTPASTVLNDPFTLYCRMESLPTLSGLSVWSVILAPAHHPVRATCVKFGYHYNALLCYRFYTMLCISII